MTFGKYFKKIFLVGLAAAIFSAAPTTFAAESANDKLIQIEKDTYGGEQTGAILNRLNKLEKDYSGRNMQGNMNARIDAVYDILYQNSGEPSIIAKINALEWNVNHEIQPGGIDKRLELLENSILGAPRIGSFSYRIRYLSKYSFGTEDVPLIQMQIPENTLIKVSLTDAVDSRTLQPGDVVGIKVSEDVLLNGRLILAKGLQGEGEVLSVRKAKGWTGRNGKVRIEFNRLRTIDGQTIEIFVGDEAKNEMTAKSMIEGASLVGMNLNDDWNKAMVHGKNIDITAGTELYVQTKNLQSVYALSSSRGAVRIADDYDDYDDDEED